MNKFLNDFKNFAMKGNVIDMATGVIIGVAFGKIVSSLVNDILMPIIGMIFGLDFSQLVVTVNNSPIAIGLFIQAIVNFLIIAFVLFLLVKSMNKLRKPAVVEEAPVVEAEEVLLLREIRDSLKK